MNIDASVRADQERFARRVTVGDAPKKKFVAKGHDAQLQEAQQSGSPVTILLNNIDGELFGSIIRRDRYTITVRHTQVGDTTTTDSIIYKHAIAMISTPTKAH